MHICRLYVTCAALQVFPLDGRAVLGFDPTEEESKG